MVHCPKMLISSPALLLRAIGGAVYMILIHRLVGYAEHRIRLQPIS